MSTAPPRTVSDALVRAVTERLTQDKPVRRTLPSHGRLHVDRRLPFLCVYRRRRTDPDGGAHRLVMGEAAYLVGDDDDVRRLVRPLVAAVAPGFGGFLAVEVWTGPVQHPDGPPSAPAFRVRTPPEGAPQRVVEALRDALGDVVLLKAPAHVEVAQGRTSPPGARPLVPRAVREQLRMRVIGVEVRPVHVDAQTGETFPLLRRALHRGLSRALKRAFYEFALRQTNLRPRTYFALGRRRVVKAVWDADRALADVSSQFDFLMQVTPVNTDAAYNSFRRSRFDVAPELHYRPRPVDPALLKRRLYAVPIERIEDPTLAHLLHEKRLELDAQVTMLDDRDTPRFLAESLQVFGGADAALTHTAQRLLSAIPPRAPDRNAGKPVGAAEVARLAEAEVERFRDAIPDLRTSVEIRADVTGLMVSRGNVLVGRRVKVPAARARALLAHEVGTHVLTYLNGRSHRMRLLASGLAGYEELQEGLAVFAEYLAGGLSRRRLRLIAARVEAVRAVCDGAGFVETFRLLHGVHRLDQKAAYSVTVRVHRGGGFTKDVVYLRGLGLLLDHLRAGGDLEGLYTGKIALDHLPIVEELLERGVLRTPPLRPAYLDDDDAVRRLEAVRKGMDVIDLVRRTA